MKKFLLTTVVATSMLVLAPQANADESSFLDAVSSAGIHPINDGNVGALLRWGNAVCVDKAIGRTLDTTLDNVVGNNPEMDYESAKVFIMAANIYLC